MSKRDRETAELGSGCVAGPDISKFTVSDNSNH